ncbi:ATP synthase F1 subunit gamma [Clostridium thermarum]|uniref:ATP synthase F1 subunit gamma n=1 Tax=Clostridium thermarum TaxID=1716543 RepID=UPI0013D79BA3|nr:ATP synthase F1 subunit gamma [Clostridium thermarum]
MAGAGLIAIKRRMKSVINTRKITKAMSLVATAKLRKSRTSLTKAQAYNSKFLNIFDEILKNSQGKSIYTSEDHGKKLYVVITSESGLCGGYNVAIVNKAVELTRNDKDNSLILVIGQKGRSHFKRLKYETAAEYVEVPDIPTIKEANTISDHIIELYKRREVTEVYIVYTKFISSVKMEPEIEKLLPIKTEEDIAYTQEMVFEPSAEECFDYLVEKYIRQQVYFCLTSAKSSEHASRMNAMDGATKNANDILNKLTLKYNRIRQSSITQEISEIVGGAEAQK